MTRWCEFCGRELPIECFPTGRGGDGIPFTRRRCRTCFRYRVRGYYRRCSRKAVWRAHHRAKSLAWYHANKARKAQVAA